MPREHAVQIRDPVHGTLQLSRAEMALVDHPAMQRLRYIKQLGLADLAYPGATHTRYVHSVGTMHVATLMFQALTRDYTLAPRDHARLQGTLRLAALFHDVGHAPLSHTTERFMPDVGKLNLGGWQAGDGSRRANHEDYTLKIITDSALSDRIAQLFGDMGVTPEDVATVTASGRVPRADSSKRFVVDGRDWLPLLRQCVSSELDADRMDYLLRDAYYAGVAYGRFDLEWLLENLLPVERQGSLSLGLRARAGFGFEDYLLSRYHMFLSVYLHHVPIAYEAMLERYHADAGDELELPADVESYLQCDDVFLLSSLRASNNPWAKRLVERRAYRRVLETKTEAGDVPTDTVERALEAVTAAGIDALTFSVDGSISKYVRAEGSTPEEPKGPGLFIVSREAAVPVEDALPLYQRYGGRIRLARLFADPERADEARAIVDALN